MDLSNSSSESESIDIDLNEQSTQGPREPVAIVGIGCRFPGGASTPKAFWNMIRRKKDAIVDVPGDRWDVRRFYDDDPAKPGKMYVKQGGFLKEKIDRFDPLFFGISPREAESMDPQQRLLLEVVWEAFEDGGLIESDLKESRTGVFIGGFCMDSMLMRFGQLNRELANSHSAASSTMTMLSNRISYAFDLKGPSVTMDTACSSSLVATHYGCQSIWSGESEMAIVGGVNVMLRPEFPIVMSKGKFLSTHGRCKAFDEDAAGYARGEGAGVVILKPLSIALKNRDRIYGLIKETGINQDGRTAGITLPDSESQETLAKEVYRKAGIDSSKIEYVEAHGTGTQAGDPAEINALDKALGHGRDAESKCYVGSVKTNIGHLEAAAGVAGLIKAVLSLYHEKILPNLHFKTPNTKIPWDDVCITIPTSEVAWKRGGRTRYAGVNSFGYGGTNAHALLQEAPAQGDYSEGDFPSCDRPLLLPISARSKEALRELAGKYAFFLATNSDDRSLANFCYTAAYRRVHHDHRAAVLADDVKTLRTRLQQFSSGEVVDQLSSDLSDDKQAAKLVFVYTGMGPQWWAMGRELMETELVFKEAIRRCDELFQKQAGWSILKELSASESDSRMAKTEVAQPANFVIQVGLTELWKSWGIEPHAVVGHSVGEVASAYVSGALSLEDAITVSVYRSQLQQTLAGKGAMLAAGISEETALALIDGYDGVSIAAINSTSGVTLSGDADQLDSLAATLVSQGVFNRKLAVEVAYHSGQMEPIKESILDALNGISPRKTKILLYSTVEGGRIQGDELSASYWWKNVRQPVRFAQSVKALLADGCSDFLEIGPHPVLGHSIKELAANEDSVVRLTPSLHRKFPEQTRMLESLGQMYTQGQKVNWEPVTPSGGALVQLPSYPWQKERYWIETDASLQDRLGESDYPLLKDPRDGSDNTWRTEIGSEFFPYLKDHVVNEEIVFPGAGYVEAGLEAYRRRYDRQVCLLRDIELHNIFFIKSNEVQYLDTTVESGITRFSIFGESGGSRKLHARGYFVDALVGSAQVFDVREIRSRLFAEIEIEALYEMLEGRGLSYGPEFRRAEELFTHEDEFLVRIDASSNSSRDAENYILHPAVLDTAIHCTLSIIPGESPFVPVSIKQVILRSSVPEDFWCYGIVTKRTSEVVEADLFFLNEGGESIGEIKCLSSRKLDNKGRGSGADGSEYLYEPVLVSHQPSEEIVAPEKESQSLIMSREIGGAEYFQKALQSHGTGSNVAVAGSGFEIDDDGVVYLDFELTDQIDRLIRELSMRDIGRVYYIASFEDVDKGASFDSMTLECASLSNLASCISQVVESCSFIIVTRGVEADESDKSVNLNHAPLSGFARLIGNEFPNLKCSHVDLPLVVDSKFLESKIGTIAKFEGDELVLRSEGDLSRKLAKLTLNRRDDGMVERVVDEKEPYAVNVSDKEGSKGDILLQSFERTNPSDRELEVQIHYACLTGESPVVFDGSNEAYVVGVVSRIGGGVDVCGIGDRVIARTRSAFRTYANISADCVARVSDEVNLEDVFDVYSVARACHAIEEVAKLRSGESILIHEATDSFGLAAAFLARAKGAVVVATASSPERRELLRSAGISGVFDSRTLEFVDGVGRMIIGGKVDVVLNVLSGEQLTQSLGLLARDGRFVDVRAIEERVNQFLPISLFGANVTFASIDFDSLHLGEANWIEKTLERNGAANPLDLIGDSFKSMYPISQCANAIERFSTAEFAGRCLVKFAGEKVNVSAIDEKARFLSRAGSYLITGGTGGFGLEVAGWLAHKGVGKLYLVSRSGGKGSKEFEEALTRFEKAGVRVRTFAVDISDQGAVAKMMQNIDEDDIPLRGIFHGAMVLDDGFLGDLNRDRYAIVMGPKILGALNLYKSSKLGDLKFFVSFSSISTLVGNKGQGNYIAANGFLDRFSSFLRSKGINGITVNWGVLGESGVVSRDKALGEHLSREGLKGMTNAAALGALGQALSSRAPQIGAFNVDWDEWKIANGEISESALFSDIASSGSSDSLEENDEVAIEIAESIVSLSDAERKDRIQELLRYGLSKILKLSEKRIDCRQSLDKLGIDSLMLLELAITVQSEFGVRVTTMDLLKVGNVAELADLIILKLMESLNRTV